MQKWKLWILEQIILSTGGKSMANFLKGYKTIVGLIGIAIYMILFAFGIKLPDLVLQVFGLLVGVGVTSKLARAEKDVAELKDLLTSVKNGK